MLGKEAVEGHRRTCGVDAAREGLRPSQEKTPLRDIVGWKAGETPPVPQ